MTFFILITFSNLIIRPWPRIKHSCKRFPENQLFCYIFVYYIKEYGIWLSLSYVPWFSGYTWRFIYLHRDTQSLKTRVHMTILTGSKKCFKNEYKVPEYTWVELLLGTFLSSDDHHNLVKNNFNIYSVFN